MAAPRTALPRTILVQALINSVEREVIELHVFFESWFGGTVARDGSEAGRLTACLAPEFELAGPKGTVATREEIVHGVASAWGKDAAGGIRIRIKNVRCSELADGLWLAKYEEWQEVGGVDRGRRSTAVMRRHDDAPLGIVWVHLHETWMPES